MPQQMTSSSHVLGKMNSNVSIIVIMIITCALNIIIDNYGYFIIQRNKRFKFTKRIEDRVSTQH